MVLLSKKYSQIVYTDSYCSYNILDVFEFRCACLRQHFRINHDEKFAEEEEKNHTNGIENFWNQAKRHLRKFNGIPKEHFHLLKNANLDKILKNN